METYTLRRIPYYPQWGRRSFGQGKLKAWECLNKAGERLYRITDLRMKGKEFGKPFRLTVRIKAVNSKVLMRYDTLKEAQDGVIAFEGIPWESLRPTAN